jgi:hypothetical protein
MKKIVFLTFALLIGIFAISFTFGQGDRRNVNITGLAGSLSLNPGWSKSSVSQFFYLRRVYGVPQ